MDETGMRVLGKNYWLWTFRTPDDEVVVVIRLSRGEDVLREFFVNDFRQLLTTGFLNKHVYFPYQTCQASLYDRDDIIGTPAIDNTRTIDVQAEKFT